MCLQNDFDSTYYQEVFLDTFSEVFSFSLYIYQCPRTDLNKRSLPRPKTTIEWKLIPHRSKITMNWNPPHCIPINKIFKNGFLLIEKCLHTKELKLLSIKIKVFGLVKNLLFKSVLGHCDTHYELLSYFLFLLDYSSENSIQIPKPAFWLVDINSAIQKIKAVQKVHQLLG